MSNQKQRRKPRLSQRDEVQKFQLDYIEELAAQLPHINGVPVIASLSYELIQILNKEATEGQP